MELRTFWRPIAVLAITALLLGDASRGALAAPATDPVDNDKRPPMSGAHEYGRDLFGNGLTECPQGGRGLDREPAPLDRRIKDAVESISNGGNDRRANQDYSCFPQDETSIAVNPRHTRNVLGGANDYRLAWGSSGFYASTNGGTDWYDGIIPFPSLPNGDILDGGGDPAIVFDRSGVAYYADINFNRTDDTSGVFVSRSTNGGFTWSRPCVAVAVCVSPLDPRRAGDGVVAFTQDNDTLANGSVPAHDKEYIAAGPRPAGVAPQCFTSAHTPTACDPATIVGVDRLYVTWTIFGAVQAINFSFSDDQGRSWSPAKPISGSAAFCAFGATARACDSNQFSTPTVNPHTGYLYIAFENFNTEDENQYLLVRSHDGGATFQGPFFITPVFDVNYPRSGGPSGTRNRPDCGARGQQGGRSVLTNTCFRVNSGGNVVVDKRGGAFADDLYLVMSDNRNGTKASSNTDVFLFKSTNGGETWIGPTRVNDDPSLAPANRDCARLGAPACPAGVNTGNDQWFPWVDIGEKGDLVVVFEDRRLDTGSTASEWPTSRTRPGNYLVWFWGARCTVDSTATVTATTTSIPAAARDCLAPGAAVIPQPTAPIDPSGPVPGQGPTFVGPFRNFGISDIPSNWDYTFRAGVFAGDYSGVTVVDNRAYTLWTDARNGRSSRMQAGRNPICEQSDAFFESWDASGTARGQNSPTSTDALFAVTPCPSDIRDKDSGGHDNEDDNDDHQ